MGRRLILALAFWLAVAAPANAETVRLATGDWAPYAGADLPGGGRFVARVVESFESAGYEVEVSYVPWRRAYEMVRQGRMDVTVPWYKTEARKAEVAYPAKPVGVARTAAYYKKSRFPEGLTVTSLKDLVAQNLAVLGVNGYWYNPRLRELGAKLHVVPEATLAWRMLDLGRADVYMEGTHVARYEVPRVLGKGRLADFARAGIVNRRPLYPLFTSGTDRGRELRAIWDAEAGNWTGTPLGDEST